MRKIGYFYSLYSMGTQNYVRRLCLYTKRVRTVVATTTEAYITKHNHENSGNSERQVNQATTRKNFN